MTEREELEELIDRAARVIANCDGVDRWSGCLESTREDIRDEARALAAAGLLADPEQGSELESDWVRLAQVLGIGDAEPLPSREEAIKAAARLYIEREQLQARIDKALALHAEFKIYDECGHQHTAEDVDAGRAINVSDVGYTCADGFMYSICRSCCTDGDYQDPQCNDDHERPCWPCPTRAALLPGDETPQPEEDQ